MLCCAGWVFVCVSVCHFPVPLISKSEMYSSRRLHTKYVHDMFLVYEKWQPVPSVNTFSRKIKIMFQKWICVCWLKVGLNFRQICKHNLSYIFLYGIDFLKSGWIYCRTWETFFLNGGSQNIRKHTNILEKVWFLLLSHHSYQKNRLIKRQGVGNVDIIANP